MNPNSDGRSAHLSSKRGIENMGSINSNSPTYTAKRKLIENETNTDLAEWAKTENCTHQYTVDKTVGHIGASRNIKFVIWWYGYNAKENFIDPAARKPHHFIARYWSRNERSMNRQPHRNTSSIKPRNQHSRVSSRLQFSGENFDIIYIKFSAYDPNGQRQKHQCTKISRFKYSLPHI